MNKEAVLIAHNNTHSTSRIFRNIELIKREDYDWSIIEKRLEAIEKAAKECRKQVDDLYLIIKELPTWDDVRKAIEMGGMTFTDKDYSYQWTTEEIIEQLKQSKK